MDWFEGTNKRRDELINAAAHIAREFDRYTAYYDKNRNGRLDDGDSMTMIDHVLLHKSLHVQRVFIDHGHGGETTDHWPVVVDLLLP